jgi:hypothetical protein
VDEIARLEAFGGEKAPAGTFNIGFPNLDVHFSDDQVDPIIESTKLMSIE